MEGNISFNPYSFWNVGFKHTHSYPDFIQQINLAEASQRTLACKFVPGENFGNTIAIPSKKNIHSQIFLLTISQLPNN